MFSSHKQRLELFVYSTYVEVIPGRVMYRTDYLRLLYVCRGYSIMLWGDCGVANFFINGAKLKQHDFSDVLYNWDCC